MATSAQNQIVEPMDVEMDVDNPNPGADKARTISKTEWEKHKQDIYRIYIEERKQMPDLVIAMERKGFKASEAQYWRMLREWGYHKKTKRQKAPSSHMSSEAQRRSAIRPGSQVYNHQDLSATFPLHSRDATHLGSRTTVSQSTLNGTRSISDGVANNTHSTFHVNGPNQEASHLAVGYADPSELAFPFMEPSLMTDPVGDLGPGAHNNFWNDDSGDIFNLASVSMMTGPVNNVNTRQPSRRPSSARDVPVSHTDSGGGSSRSSGAASKKGKQPIHFAVEAGSSHVIKYLLESDPNCAHLRNEDGITPLWIASQQGHTRIVTQLIDSYRADVNVASTDMERTPLHQAAQSGHAAIVRILLDKGAQPDPRDSHGVTPLWTAAQKGSVQIVSMLVKERGVEIDATTTDGKRTALHQAAQGGHTDIVRILLKHEADVDPKDHVGVSPLWSAAQMGSEDIVRMLLEKGASPETLDASGSNCRPLHQAARFGHAAVCKLLLDHGAHHEPLDNTMCSPLFFAAQGGHSEVVRILLEKGASPDNAWEGKDGKGRRCLHQAAQNGHLETVKLLLDYGAYAEPEIDSIDSSSGDDSDSDDINDEKSRDTRTYRSYKQAWRAAKGVGKKSAKVSSKHGNKPCSCRPPSPLGLAVQSGHYAVAKLLIDRQADVNSVAHHTRLRPLHLAAYSGKEELVKLLIEHGADIDAREEDGWSPLMLAAQSGNCKMIEHLIEAGVNVNAEANSGATALWIASQQGHTVAVQKFLDAEARSFATKSSKRYPIHQAAQNAHFEVVKLLAEKDPSCVTLKDARGVSVMSLASFGRETVRVDIMKYLSSKGAPLVEEE